LHEQERGQLTAVGYAALGAGFNRVTYRRRLRAVETVLGRAHIWPSSVLEAAVGVGAYASLWRRLGVQRWVGVDISQAAVSDLRARYPGHRFEVLDLASGDHEAWRNLNDCGGYDLVTAIDVLYHLTSDTGFEVAVAELARCVRPGGYLVVSDAFVVKPTDVADHVRRRPLAAYESILRPLGLTLYEREPVFSIHGDPVVCDRGNHGARVLDLVWRLIQKAIRLTPPGARDVVGAWVALATSPFDWLLRRLGVARGANLELALFRRRSG
jgi:SAM-dependent methyltransferase